jgi:hypothetical protein
MTIVLEDESLVVLGTPLMDRKYERTKMYCLHFFYADRLIDD